MQLAAVMKNGCSIEYIYNPSEEVQLTAVKQNGFAIRFIHNPSEKVIRYVIENCDNEEIIQSMRIDFDKLSDHLKLMLDLK